jgi:hypothetical protein
VLTALECAGPSLPRRSSVFSRGTSITASRPPAQGSRQLSAERDDRPLDFARDLAEVFRGCLREVSERIHMLAGGEPDRASKAPTHRCMQSPKVPRPQRRGGRADRRVRGAVEGYDPTPATARVKTSGQTTPRRRWCSPPRPTRTPAGPKNPRSARSTPTANPLGPLIEFSVLLN